MQVSVFCCYVKEADSYLIWLDGVGRSPTGVGSLMVCSYLVIARQVIPMKVRCSLNGFESYAKIQ